MSLEIPIFDLQRCCPVIYRQGNSSRNSSSVLLNGNLANSFVLRSFMRNNGLQTFDQVRVTIDGKSTEGELYIESCGIDSGRKIIALGVGDPLRFVTLKSTEDITLEKLGSLRDLKDLQARARVKLAKISTSSS